MIDQTTSGMSITFPRCRSNGESAQRRPELLTHGEIEAEVGRKIALFEQEFMGRGPKCVQTHLIGDLLIVRLTGVLTAAEKHLAQSHPPENGCNLIKQVRVHLIESARPILEAAIFEATNVRVISLHYDISTRTGEEVIIATLTKTPSCRELKRRPNSVH